MADSESFSELVLDLAEEFIERYRKGERPNISEYVLKYPQLEDQIREVFPAMAMVERIAIDDESLEQQSRTFPVPELSQIGDYRIIREVGRGGMGIVYEAEQVSLGRRVAVKVLPRSLFSNNRVRRRFARESKSAARLHHTNIVPVFGVGEQEGLHYYVMQFIQGLGLDQVLVELRRLQQDPAVAHVKPGVQRPLPQPAGVAHASPGPADVSLDFVARSLLAGQFGHTLIVAAERQDSSASQPAVDATTDPVAAVPSNVAAVDETLAGALSNTANSKEFSLFGQSEATAQKSGRNAYWQSVARIGVQIANALQHAHQLGVVHRDIKPSNLLLDSHGNIWVTDFGLAKASDQPDLTHTGDILGTLRYMAPEQFEGKADHRTDIYSLGLTLYELLVLHPAYQEKDRHRLVKQVAGEAPPALKSLDPKLPGDLTTIIQKAIDRDLAHRYQSAQELEDDLNRFLRDEPIRARRISPVTRFSRWCRRNPAIASLTMVIALLLLVVAMGSTLAAVRFENLATRNARLVNEKGLALDAAQAARQHADAERQIAQTAQGQAEQAQAEAEAARDTEKMLREEAERQRDRANTNANRARRAVDQYLSKITDSELLTVPGMQPLRQDLLAEALKFYEEFTLEQTDDPELQIELALAHSRLAVIQRELGGLETAKATNARAIEQLESLRDRQRGGIPVLSALVEAYYFASRYDDVAALAEQILKTNPDEVPVLSTLAETYNSQALDSTKENKDIAAALALHQKAFDIRRRLVEAEPDSPDYNAEIASTINNIGVLLGEQKKTQDALTMFELAITYVEKACRLAPQSILWNRWHAISSGNVGYKYRELGQNEEALRHFTRLVEIRKRLVFQNPAISSLRSELYKDMLVLADHQKQMGLTVEASRSYRDAREVLTQMPRETPAELFQLAVVYASLVTPPEPGSVPMAEDAEATDERLRNADLALQTLEQAIDKGWADPTALKNYKAFDPLREREDFQQLAEAVETVAEANKLLAAKAKSEQEKLANQQKAAEILGKLVAGNPQQLQHQRALATTFHAMGVVQTGLRQFDEAENSLKQAIEMRDKLRELRPNDSEFTLDWLTSRVAHGQLLWESARFELGHAVWQQCLLELNIVADGHRGDAQIQEKIGAQLRVICNGYGRFGLWQHAGSILRSNSQFRRVSNQLQDAEFSALLLLTENQDFAKEYLAQLADTQPLSNSSDELGRITNLWQTAAMIPEAGPLVQKSSFLAGDRIQSGPWQKMVLATMLFQAGNTQEAYELMKLVDQIASHLYALPQSWYVKAIITSQLNDLDQARDYLNRAEDLYKQACLQSLAFAPTNSLGLPHERWHHLIHMHVQRREAVRAVTGVAFEEDPWFHLIQARGYALIGETNRAEAEIALAADAARNDPDVFLAIARLQQEWDSLAQNVEESWAREIAVAANDPISLIKRGRWYFERGEKEKAEADFARAAELTPNELNKFLEAGWWVVGPYPAELKEFCPPELDHDPSRPVHIIDPGTGLSDEPVKWRTVQVDAPHTRFPPAKVSGYSGDVTYYLLTYVYSPEERSTSLAFKSGCLPVEAWVNGDKLVTPVEDGIHWQADRQSPCVLRPGLNQILVKCSAQRGIEIALDDDPIQRAFELQKFGAYKQANERFAAIMAQRSDVWLLANAGYVALTAGDQEAYLSNLRKLKAQWELNRGSVDKLLAVELSCYGPQDVLDQSEIATVLQEWQKTWKPEENLWMYTIAALAEFRLGNLNVAMEYAEKATSIDSRSGIILAMIHHQLADTQTARSLLLQSEQVVRSLDSIYSPSGNPHLWLIWPLFREAKVMIEGENVELDALFDDFLETRQRLWEARDPMLAAFEQTIAEAPHNPHAYIARAGRLVELGRIPEAEADFNKAVSLAPNTVDPLLARCLYRADAGQIDLAADDAWQILSKGFGDLWDTVGYDFEAQLADREPVLLELLRRHPANAALHRIRGDYLAYRGRWEDARDAYTTGDPWWSQEMCAAAISVLLNDPERFAQSVERLEELWLREMGLNSAAVAYNRTLMQCLQPLAPAAAENLEAELSRHRKALPTWRSLPAGLGMAQFRRGKISEAVESFHATPGREKFWQHLLPTNPPLAMAHWQLGEHEQARQVLHRSANAIELFLRHNHESRSSGGAGSANTFWLGTFALHKEARTLIDGPEAAEAEFAALFSPHKQDAAPQPGQRERLQAYWDKAVESAGDNPLPLIQRGSWHREQGRLDQARADFEQALPLLAPESPQRLLLAEAERSGSMKIWNFADPSQVWKTLHEVVLHPIAEGVTLQSTHADPYITSSAWAHKGVTLVSLCVRSREHLPRAQIFYTTQQYPTFSESRAVRFPIASTGGDWQVVRVIFEADSDLRQLRFDPENRSELELDIAWITVHRLENQQLLQARALSMEGKLDEAAALRQEYLRLVDWDKEGWVELGICRMTQRRFTDAVETFTQALASATTDVDRSELRLYRAMALMADDRLDEALAEFNALLELSLEQLGENTWRRVQQQRCVCWLLMGDLQRHRRFCRELVDLFREETDPRLPSVVVACCKLHPQSVDDWEEVLRMAERFHEAYPQAWAAPRELFRVLCLAGKTQEALTRFSFMATEAHPGSRLLYAYAQLQIGNPQPAKDALKNPAREGNSSLWEAEIKWNSNTLREKLEEFEQANPPDTENQ